MTIENQQRFDRAIALFDAANAKDPNQDEGQPKELLYGRRMSEMIGRYAPEASEAARLAVRAQHIKRWTVPRTVTGTSEKFLCLSINACSCCGSSS